MADAGVVLLILLRPRATFRRSILYLLHMLPNPAVRLFIVKATIYRSFGFGGGVSSKFEHRSVVVEALEERLVDYGAKVLG